MITKRVCSSSKDLEQGKTARTETSCFFFVIKNVTLIQIATGDKNAPITQTRAGGFNVGSRSYDNRYS